MSNETWLTKRLKNAAGRVSYETERLILGINEQFVRQLVSQEMTRTELADRLRVDKAFITRLLNGTPNVTLKTLVSVASALGCRLSVPTLTRIEQQKQEVAPIVKFARPATQGLASSALDAFRPILVDQMTHEETSLEADPDALSAAA